MAQARSRRDVCSHRLRGLRHRRLGYRGSSFRPFRTRCRRTACVRTGVGCSTVGDLLHSRRDRSMGGRPDWKRLSTGAAQVASNSILLPSPLCESRFATLAGPRVLSEEVDELLRSLTVAIGGRHRVRFASLADRPRRGATAPKGRGPATAGSASCTRSPSSFASWARSVASSRVTWHRLCEQRRGRCDRDSTCEMDSHAHLVSSFPRCALHAGRHETAVTGRAHDDLVRSERRRRTALRSRRDFQRSAVPRMHRMRRCG